MYKETYDNKSVQFGGTAFTLSLNENIPMEEATKIESAFRELHSGLYTYGTSKLAEAIKLGYIESTAGFKLKLPDFEEFQELDKEIQDLDKAFWELYREGKKEYKAIKEAKEKNPPEVHVIQNKGAYNRYMEYKNKISRYFSLKSGYMRLCLNNPTQATAAHQTKLALCMLFEYIEEHNHLWRARIANAVHDEIVMEVEDSLCDEYQDKLGYFMREGGDFFLKKGLFKMSADANIGSTWYEAK